jgi:hypothetical protein
VLILSAPFTHAYMLPPALLQVLGSSWQHCSAAPATQDGCCWRATHLHVVFAKHPLPRCIGFLESFHWLGLADRHQTRLHTRGCITCQLPAAV